MKEVLAGLEDLRTKSVNSWLTCSWNCTSFPCKIGKFAFLLTTSIVRNVFLYTGTNFESIALHEVSKYGFISGPYFPVFGLNTERYFASFRIQSEYRKKRTRNNSAFGHLHEFDWIRSFIAIEVRKLTKTSFYQILSKKSLLPTIFISIAATLFSFLFLQIYIQFLGGSYFFGI